jgi:hypothetical protein
VIELLPPSFAATRRDVHALAEHVLCAVRYAAVGRIGLDAADDGVITPEFAGRVVGLRGTELVDGSRCAPVSTLRDAADFFGVVPGPPPLWEPSTDVDLDEPLTIAADGVAALARWFALGRAALAAIEPDAVPTLWPEHFDLAVTTASGHIFGASPGDATHPAPYLYVVPAAGPIPDGDADFWAEPFGASLGYDRVAGLADAATFFVAAAGRLAANRTEVTR